MAELGAAQQLPAQTLPRALTLPDFPWDSLRPYRARAAQHPDGVVDLAVGTPVDPSPAVAQTALRAAANAPGYPTALGSAELRAAINDWWARRRGVTGLSEAEVIPTIGSKESVALLALQLGARPGDLVLHPRAAYPTYDVGARLAGATPVPVDTDADPDSWQLPSGPDGAAGRPVIVWLNSPGNPDGHVLGVEQLARIVAWARQRGAIVISDECYAELAWAEPWASQGVPSLLDPRVTGTRPDGSADRRGLIALYSLSKQSNLAGYRAAFLAGDAALVGAVTEVRKHSGLLVPAPVQAAMTAVLADPAHVAAQVEVYRARREALLAATASAGLVNDPASVAGLYLWLRGPASMSAFDLVGAFAELGIVVAPGDFYGEAGAGRVRVSLTDSDERVAAACRRLQGTALFRP
ncbi:LL-diaminopimelate aminotransferase [Actinomyces bovis]|uniref:Aminotransferase n=1 Tax=Actinomyces bovis TaxID=1658 RepID=A0ABY1VM91_9ACTO|nr:succinyldiaminopimelate transaminase [Actinomyces bovis]SPT53223.1 LL-diaminopimelate aminotransferase [Actinomyces bovis]VEG52461.1 LL-diaminopimelate aminotransferase [Actinomyces israelii]